MHSNNLSIVPPVIAHRGASAYAPENTLAAFLKAKELGIRWLEFDVMLAACGEVVIIHDQTVDRTTSGEGRVIDCTYHYLQTLDAGTWFHPEFAEEKIPCLQKMIEFLHQHNLAANVEIKVIPGNEELTVKKIIEVIQQYWHQEMLPPLISSFSLATLHYVRKYFPHCLLALLMDNVLPEWKDICDELNCVSVALNEKAVTPDLVDEIKSTGRSVLSYTVNNADRARELFSWEVDAVFTDYPDKILAVCKK